jgi:polysaccharide export outer membrane protein
VSAATAALLWAGALLLQSPQMETPAATAPAAAPAPHVYRVGPGDVLEIAVAGRPELGRLVTVQPTGALRLPGGEDLPVSGLSADEVAARVAAALAGAGAAPAVTVRVREHRSQFVWVRGAVVKPGRQPLRGGTRLVDALLDAGGFARTASGEVVVERAGGFSDGSRERRYSFGTSPGARELRELALVLEAGDRVTAAIQQWVAVGGAVSRPGRYPLRGDSATLREVVERAGGPLRGAGSQLVVRRRDAAGVPREIVANLEEIVRGRAADVPLLGGDEVVVGRQR